MIILSDENLISPELTDRLNILGARYGCRFVRLPPEHYGVDDTEVAKICGQQGAAALLTVNYKDFAAKVIYFQALVEAGVSAIALRQPNSKTENPDIAYQVNLIEPYLEGIVRRLEHTDEALLFMVNKSGIRHRRLQELIDERSA